MHTRHLSKRTPAKGQNLTEFILPASITLVTVGILVSGTPLLDAMFQALNGSVNGEQQGKTIQVKALGSLSSPVVSQDVPFPSLSGKIMTFTLANGQQISINLADPEAVAEVAGGNGVTGNALSALDQLIAQLTEANPEDPKIPPLAELSRRGHLIQEMQALVEGQFPPEGFKSPSQRDKFLAETTVTFQGKEMALIDVVRQLNYFYYSSSDSYYKSGNMVNSLVPVIYEHYKPREKDDPNVPIISFMNQLHEIRHSDQFQDPAMQALVNEILAKQIFVSAEQTIYTPTKEQVGELVEDTEVNSKRICKLSKFHNCVDRSAG